MSSPTKAQTSGGGTALSGTGTGTAPSPKTPLARTTPPAGRRSSVRRPNGASSPAPGTPSPLSGKGGGADGELAKLTRDQLVSLLTTERKSLSDLQSTHSTLLDTHSSLQSSSEAKDDQLQLLKGKLEEREKEVGRAEEEVGRLSEEKEGWEAKGKELERVKGQLRESEKKAREEAETYETERAAWIKQEQQLKLRISTLRKELPSPRRPPTTDLPPPSDSDTEPPTLPEDPTPPSSSTSPVVTILEAQDVATTDEPEEEINFRRSPSFRQPRLHGSTSTLSPPSPGASSPTLRSVTPPSGSASSTLPGVPLPPEMMAEWASLRTQHSQLLTTHSTLSSLLESVQLELADEKRVNQRLMEENESYEILVGEKTLRGEIDLEALLGRSYDTGDGEGDEEGESEEGMTSYSASVTSGRQLEGVKEEDEEEEDEGTPNPNAEDDVEQMILETQGSGSPAHGAVEAKPSSTTTTTKGRKSLPKGNKPMGLGLDLAAEMEKAEEEEEEAMERAREREREKEMEKEEMRKKALRRQQGRQGSASTTPGGPNEVAALRAEVKNLKDANKALSLYISKIIDRIVAMDGFEKVLSADYGKNAATPPGTATQSAFAAAVKGGNRDAKEKEKEVQEKEKEKVKSPAVEAPKQPTKRMSLGWGTLSPTALFGGSASSTSKSGAPPVPPAGMKPLKLVNPTSTASVSGGTTPVREASPPVPGTEEDEEDARERERLRAEMKLHGIEKPSVAASSPVGQAGIEQTLEGAFVGGVAGDTSSLKTSTSSRASRRTSGFYASSSPQVISSSATSASSKAPGESPPLSAATVTGAAVLKREDDREREIRANLERGSAGGFTEIRVSGHRRRPSNSTTKSGGSTPSTSFTRTPDLEASGRRSASPLVTSPTVEMPQPSLSASTGSASGPPMSPAVAGAEGLDAGESMFSRAARRISFNWAAKPPELPPKPDKTDKPEDA